MKNADLQEIIRDLIFNVTRLYSTQGRDGSNMSAFILQEGKMKHSFILCYSVRLIVHRHIGSDILCHHMLCFPTSYILPLGQKISYVLSKNFLF